jgi:hypothetical protein
MPVLSTSAAPPSMKVALSPRPDRRGGRGHRHRGARAGRATRARHGARAQARARASRGRAKRPRRYRPRITEASYTEGTGPALRIWPEARNTPTRQRARGEELSRLTDSTVGPAFWVIAVRRQATGPGIADSSPYTPREAPTRPRHGSPAWPRSLLALQSEGSGPGRLGALNAKTPDPAGVFSIGAPRFELGTSSPPD